MMRLVPGASQLTYQIFPRYVLRALRTAVEHRLGRRRLMDTSHFPWGLLAVWIRTRHVVR